MNATLRARSLGWVVLLAACGTPEGASAPSYGAIQGQALGTTWSVRWAPVEALDAATAQATTDRVLAEVDAGMSTWRDDSEIMRVRAADGPLPVSEDTADVVRAALVLAEATGGAFDPTVKPLMDLWGLHGNPRSTWPSPDEIAQARGAVGWERVRVGRDAEGRPTLDDGGTVLDLSAIAKGHAVDRVMHALVAEGATELLVEVGGEVRTAGRSPRGGAWTVGVDRPVPGSLPGQDFAAVVAASNRAVATSGNYRNALSIGTRTVHHTMDPRTGHPARNPARSATVIATDTRAADGWATALMVLGAEGLPLVEARPDLEAWLLVEGPSGEIQPLATSGMATFLDRVALEPSGPQD